MMTRESMSVMSTRSRHCHSVRRNRSLKPLDRPPSPPADELVAQLLKFRIDGRMINARNVDELYPGLDRLLLRCLQTGDCRQLDNRLNRNLKAEYLLITGHHIRISVASKTQDILDRLVKLGATLDLHFYEPVHQEELELLCKYGCDINVRLAKYNYQTPLAMFISKNSSIDMVHTLIRYGARFDVQDNQGQTCLHIACQSNVNDLVFEYLINASPLPCFNIRNQFGGTPLDLVYISTYEQGNVSRMRRLHLLLSKPESKLTRYGMREPNLFLKKQYKLFDILASKEFLFKYRLRDLFDSSIRPLAWCLFLFYDVLRVCEQSMSSHAGQSTIQNRLENYLISMIENGEISLNKLIFGSNSRFDPSLSSTPTNELEQQMLTDAQNSLLHMAQIKSKLTKLRMQTLTLKALCRIKIKNEIGVFPNDIVKLHQLSKFHQAYLTYYNPFVKARVQI